MPDFRNRQILASDQTAAAVWSCLHGGGAAQDFGLSFHEAMAHVPSHRTAHHRIQAKNAASFKAAPAKVPNLKHASTEYHGYAVMELTAGRANCDIIATADRKAPEAAAFVVQNFAVLDGQMRANPL